MTYENLIRSMLGLLDRIQKLYLGMQRTLGVEEQGESLGRFSKK